MPTRSPLFPVGFVEPCLPTLARAVPSGPRWAHEIKHDGFRFICQRDGGRVRVFSRNARDWTDRVPQIAEALRALPVNSATLDGEGVVIDDRGVSDFERLHLVLSRHGSREAILYAFDLIELDGQDLRPHPWETRRATLASLLRKAAPGLRLSEHLDNTDGQAVFRHACAMGLEGIASKRRDRPYRSGRSSDWVKIKNPDAPAATRVIEW